MVKMFAILGVYLQLYPYTTFFWIKHSLTLFEQNLYLLQYTKMLKENVQELTSELQRQPVRFSFLPAPGHAEF